MGRLIFNDLRMSVTVFAACTSAGWAQPPKTLTLEEAKTIALRNHPRIHGAGLLAEAVNTTVAQARAPLYPAVSGNLTGAGSPENAAIAAGALTTSSLSSRLATGLVASQMITDFGRTSSLTATARLKAAAQSRNIDTTKAQVVQTVEQSYYQALGAQALLRAAQAALENRRLTLRQVKALAESSFKSTLDVSFAEVAVSEAELQTFRAENDVQAGQARLAAALGYDTAANFELVDESMPPPLDSDVDMLISQAIRNRPDLASVSLNRDAALRFADAEKRLKYPSVSVLAVTGEVPQRIAPFRGNYGAAGLNINIPLLNGGLYAARRAEADFRARAAGEDVHDLAIQI